VKPKGQAKDRWDLIALGGAVPGASEPLEVLAPTREQNPCSI
jgi:branched-chain amino acid transport system substrate-binding protein